MKHPDLTGKTALITGGGRGIGRATAFLLAQCHATVVITARGGAEIEAVAKEIKAVGGEALAKVVDVSRQSEVRDLFTETGPVEIVVNNAGVIAPIGPVVSVDPDEWSYNIDINLVGIFFTSHYAVKGMSERGWGRIVNVSSGAARGSVTGWSAYSAAKAGVEALTKVMAQEVEGTDIRVNAIRPGIVDTEMQVEIRSSSEERFGTENLARFRGYKERGLLRAPDDPAKLILWLLSPEADQVNGEVLTIDEEEVAARIGLTSKGR